MALPQEGNRIRVHGMAPYDARAGRGWHEVNPVFIHTAVNWQDWCWRL